jgi:ribosomal protein L7/L12
MDAPQPPPVTATTVPTEIIRLISMGRKIEAIKMYRDMAGVGLKEAKDAIDKLTANKTI